MYELLKYVHILCAIAWVGGGFAISLFGERAARSSSPTALAEFARSASWIGQRVSMPASFVLFVAGVLLTIQRWAFQDAWISIGILLWLAAVVFGGAFIGRNSGRALALFDADATSEEATSIILRVLSVGRVELVLMLVVIALMVFKPTLG